MAINITLKDENDLYSALPLGDSMIRVIDVHQNHVGYSAPANTLSGQLRAVTLSDKPKFVALSYSWGSQESNESPYGIQLSVPGVSARIRIPETAYQAIGDVSDHYKGQLTLWIDTVCINQNDNLEKEAQIPLMSEIYSNAEIVYVHLGRTESTDAALDWMIHITQRRYRGTGIHWPGRGGAASQRLNTFLLVISWTVINRFLYPIFAIPLLIILFVAMLVLLLVTVPIFLLRRKGNVRQSPPTRAAGLDAQKLLSINSLLSRPWIQRAWTWQELVLARNAVILCGSKALSWDRFLLSLSVLELCSQGLKKPLAGQAQVPRASIGTLMEASGAYRKAKEHFPQNPKLENLNTWCFLGECWLRFGRSFTTKTKKGSNNTSTFLDYHLKIYSTCVIVITCLLSLPLLAIIAILIWSSGVTQNAHRSCEISFDGRCLYYSNPITPSPSPPIYIILILNTISFVFSIGLYHRARKGMRNYCKLPMAFAVVPVLRTRKATDPRDICYGFYGVLQAEGIKSFAAPDYQKDPRIVFREFFLELIQWESKALILLMDCCNYAEPSWSPDWRVTSPQSWLDEAYFFGNTAISATPASVPYFDVTDDKLGLFVYGNQIGQAGVIWAGANLVPDDLVAADAEKDTDVKVLHILLEWIRTGIRLRSGFATGISPANRARIFEILEQDFRKVPIQYQNTLGRIMANAGPTNGFATWLDVIEPYALGVETPGTEMTVRQQADTSPTRLGDSESVVQCYERLLASEKALEYHRRICNSIIRQRRLFIYSGPEGFQFSAGSLATAVGDIAYLISGLPVPMILRNAGGLRQFTQNGHQASAQAFLVIGPALISGMMKGEMWSKREKAAPLPKDQMKRFYLV